MKKILIAVLCLVVVLVGGGAYLISTIDKKEIKQKIETLAADQFPNAIFKIGNIDYSLGFKVTFELDKLEILNKRDKTTTFKVSNLLAKIPILNILTKKGTISLLIEKPLINYLEYKNGNNVAETFSSGKNETAEKKEESSKSDDSSGFDLKSVSLDVYMNDANVIYTSINRSKSKVLINKLKLKNVGSNESVVYEALLKVDQSDKSGHVFSGDLQLVGDANLKDVMFNKSFFSKFHIDISSMYFGRPKQKLFDFKGNGDFSYVKNVLNSNFNFKGGELFSGKFALSNDGKVTTIKDINLSIILSQLKSFVNLGSLKEKIGFNNSKLNLNGKAKILENGNVLSSLKFLTTEKVLFNSELGETTSVLDGSINEATFQLNTDTQIMGGNINTRVSLQDVNRFLKNNHNQKNPIEITTIASNLNLTEEYIQKKMYDNKVVKEKTVKSEEVVKTESPSDSEPTMLPATKINFKVLKSKLGQEDISIVSDINLYKNAATIDRFNINLGKGSSRFNGKYEIGKKSDLMNMSLELKQMNLSSFKAFLPEKLGSITGYFSGQSKGSVKIGKEISYSLVNNFKATQGEIKELDIGKYMQDLFSNELIKSKISEKDIKFNSRFKSLDLSLNATEHKLDINNIMFIGDEKSADFKGKGFVGMNTGRPSEMFIDVKDNKGKIKKAFNLTYLPVKLIGDSFSLKPKLSYTTKALTKNVINNEKKKLKSKVKKKIDKEKDKLKDKLKEKAGKLLKGLF